MPLNKSTVIFIVGPTAIGKTSLALKLARRVNGEIISCDSMQIYKGMNILSQSPGSIQTGKTRYHMVRFTSPTKEYNIASFRNKAAILIDGIIERKKIPIIAGGTGLYVKGLIDGLFPTPEADLKFRKKSYDYASRYGSARLHKKLEKIDPESAKLIHPNNTKRIVRALEIRHSTGRTMTELKRDTKGIADRYRIKIFGLTKSREKIYSDINNRVDKMFEDGVIREVKRLSSKRLSRTAKAALGLKELTDYLNGKTDLERAKDLMKQNTRRYAKRQFTWFRADGRVRWFDTDKLSAGEIIKKIRIAAHLQ